MYVAAYLQDRFVIWYLFVFENTLKKNSTPFVFDVEVTGVAVGYVGNYLAESGGVFLCRSHEEVEMVWHHSVGQEPRSFPLTFRV